MKIRMTIGRLVLDGIDVAAAERPRLKAAVESEIARIVAERGIASALRQGAALPSLPAPHIEAGRPAKPAQLGTAIGGAVAAGLGGDRR